MSWGRKRTGGPPPAEPRWPRKIRFRMLYSISRSQISSTSHRHRLRFRASRLLVRRFQRRVEGGPPASVTVLQALDASPPLDAERIATARHACLVRSSVETDEIAYRALKGLCRV